MRQQTSSRLPEKPCGGAIVSNRSPQFITIGPPIVDQQVVQNKQTFQAVQDNTARYRNYLPEENSEKSIAHNPNNLVRPQKVKVDFAALVKQFDFSHTKLRKSTPR
jgi:hypothetical protein